VNWLLDKLRSPSAFNDDPRGYAINQLGHAFVIGFLPLAAFGAWGLLVLPLYAVWEIVQYRRYQAELSDCFEDAAFVTLGAAIVSPPLAIAALILFLWAGAQKRREWE
jgi:hypothetical protein